MNFKALLLTAAVAATGAIAAPAQAWETYHVEQYTGTRNSVEVISNNYPMVTVRTNSSYSGVQNINEINCSTRQLRYAEADVNSYAGRWKKAGYGSSNVSLVNHICN